MSSELCNKQSEHLPAINLNIIQSERNGNYERMKKGKHSQHTACMLSVVCCCCVHHRCIHSSLVCHSCLCLLLVHRCFLHSSSATAAAASTADSLGLSWLSYVALLPLSYVPSRCGNKLISYKTIATPTATVVSTNIVITPLLAANAHHATSIVILKCS